jgi:hypothetical protein
MTSVARISVQQICVFSGAWASLQLGFSGRAAQVGTAS